MRDILTRRQQDILSFLIDRREFYDYPPTIADLCRDLGLRSRGSLHKHVQALVKAGLIQSLNGQQRGIRLTGKALQQINGLPFVGYIAAGQPIEAIENPEPLEVPAFLKRGDNCFVLRVQGDSMIEEGIFDGDWIVVERRDYARNGEIVVALIGGAEATLKRIQQRPGAIILYPANKDLEPMSYPPEQVQIQGVLVGQMRAYR